MWKPVNIRDRIIVALDVDTFEKAELLVQKLKHFASCFKAGPQFLNAVGTPQAVSFLHSNGVKVFIDEKFNDIPHTVGKAAGIISSLGVHMFNVHASAGQEAIEAAVKNRGRSLVLGVTVLTSIDDEECVSIFGDVSGKKVLQFGRMLLKAGAQGIICSPRELELLQEDREFDRLFKVNPGIRPKWAGSNDQRRVMTPTEAILAGADALVIGRPLTDPPKEVGEHEIAGRMILRETECALKRAGR